MANTVGKTSTAPTPCHESHFGAFRVTNRKRVSPLLNAFTLQHPAIRFATFVHHFSFHFPFHIFAFSQQHCCNGSTKAPLLISARQTTSQAAKQPSRQAASQPVACVTQTQREQELFLVVNAVDGDIHLKGFC